MFLYLTNLRRNKLRRFLASMRCSSHLLHIVADCTADTPSGQRTAASARHPQPWSLKASSICCAAHHLLVASQHFQTPGRKVFSILLELVTNARCCCFE